MIAKAFSRGRRKGGMSAELVALLVEDCRYFEAEFTGEKQVVAVYEESETSTGKIPWHKEVVSAFGL